MDWIKYGQQHLLNRKIVAVRYMTEKEQAEVGWSYRPIVLHLDNGSMIYPSMDDEGNDAGALFGQDKKGKELVFPVLRSNLEGRNNGS